MEGHRLRCCREIGSSEPSSQLVPSSRPHPSGNLASRVASQEEFVPQFGRREGIGHSQEAPFSEADFDYDKPIVQTGNAGNCALTGHGSRIQARLRLRQLGVRRPLAFGRLTSAYSRRRPVRSLAPLPTESRTGTGVVPHRSVRTELRSARHHSKTFSLRRAKGLDRLRLHTCRESRARCRRTLRRLVITHRDRMPPH